MYDAIVRLPEDENLIQATFDALSGVPIAKDSAVLEAGVDLNLTSSATFGLSYAGQLAGPARDHGGEGESGDQVLSMSSIIQ